MAGTQEGKLHTLHRALAAHPGEPVLFADLIREVWGDTPPTGPLPALRTLVKRLRRSIQDEIVTDASGYRLKVRTPGPCQLPADLLDFVGREHELERLERQEGVIAITGAPGVGKTALAVRLAHRLREQYFDGQLYVNMRAFASGTPVTPGQALSRFLKALGVPQAAIPVSLDAQAELYQKKLVGKRVLVVLDNAVEDMIELLLPNQPGCLAILTSRHDLPGQLRLDVLGDDAARELLVRMRVEGTDEERAELVRLCAHLPLALRIAGANVAYGHIEDYLDELRGDRLTVLEIDGDAAVRATFDLSYRALSSAAKRVFRLVGLSPGADIGVDAVTALAGSASGAQLDELVRAGLIDHVGGRYQLHDLIRLFAADAADGDDRVRLLHSYSWYLRTAYNAIGKVIAELSLITDPDLSGACLEFEGREDATAWLEEEHANLVAAVLAAPSPYAQQLADVVRIYLHVGRFETEKALVFEAGLRAARAAGDRAGQCAALFGLGMSAWGRGEYSGALDCYEAALEQADDPGSIATIRNNFGLVHLELGEVAQARAQLTEALALRRQIGDERAAASTLMNLGISHGARGELREAARYIEQAYEVCARHGMSNQRALVLDNLSVAYFELGELDRALDASLESVRLHTEEDHPRALANALASLARIRAERGEIDEGLTVASRCFEVSRDAEHPKSRIDCLVAMAVLEPEKAGQHAGDAVELGRKIGYEPGVITASILLAQATGSVELIDAVLTTIRETDSFMDHSRALLARARITGSVDTAREALQAAEDRSQAKVASDARSFLATG
ncbi:tetratricopeptide repeat protein [Lentzea sp. BCCO 10_0061]|uniref:Tetratricopeptide repeat protein n=1 Tax=Lentzea sokolovensis TaxID=3095429 RepID=A0ABU4V7L4_9PSEU|nr:tetratricopeptide repeat protein [Lentzea sp. BCCO 10_0061]MDX8147787.1 tetratricopeptide repeat protein [Lentzea sp. BCCO 10_0061]